ncbi:MAG TPA: lipopolysaccharide heptosyltransferase II [Verrucomicrobiae bacterium]|jgi:heptosyltransferase-2|nr:lipopolysaccharide heptosyltransferase II [Verrucomicrobiae bacterium]
MDTEKILVRGVNWLGDAVMTLPALQRLREARPAARITLLTPQKLAGLWEGQPMIDNVLTLAPGECPWHLRSRLRPEHFDIGVAFPNSFRAALELWLAGIPRRFGASHGLRNLLLTDVAPPRAGFVKMRRRSDREVRQAVANGVPPVTYPASAHHIHHYLQLTSRLGASAVPLPPQWRVTDEQVRQALAKFQLPEAASNRPYFGLNPGAEYGPAKRWPAERFVEAAQKLQAARPGRWLIFGGAGDAALAASVAADLDAVNLAGKTTLPELASLLKACQVLLTNDTGPMHLAAAVGVPVVVPFGSTSPELTGPIFSPDAKVLRKSPPCAPCFRRECPIDLRCLTAIQADDVARAALECLPK